MGIAKNKTFSITRYKISPDSFNIKTSEELNRALLEKKIIPIPSNSSRQTDAGWTEVDNNNEYCKTYNSYYLFKLRFEQKKISSSLLNQLVDDVLKQLPKKPKRKEINQIKEKILHEELIPQTPVHISTQDVIYDKNNSELIILNASTKILEIFELLVAKTFKGIVIQPKYNICTKELDNTKYNYFLTWLIWKIENKIDFCKNKFFSIFPDKKILLLNRSTICLIKDNDMPQKTIEALKSLGEGSKVSQASFSSFFNETQFSFTLDSKHFYPKSLKLPKSDQLNDSLDSIVLINLDYLKNLNQKIDDLFQIFTEEFEKNTNLFSEIKKWYKEFSDDHC